MKNKGKIKFSILVLKIIRNLADNTQVLQKLLQNFLGRQKILRIKKKEEH